MPRTKLPQLSRSGTTKARLAKPSSSSLAEVPKPHSDIATYVRRRRDKAERDERMDLTTVLTPVKTYMAGFTRPRHLRTASWQQGGYYAIRRSYESPPPLAYKPRTVYLLEARHETVEGQGRTDQQYRILDVCWEADLVGLIKTVNSPRATSRYTEHMDNARWPWSRPRRRKRVRWWEEGEDPVALRQQALEALDVAEASTVVEPRRHSAPRTVPAELLSLGPGIKDAPHIRAFHTSAVARNSEGGDKPDSQRRREDIPTSSWSRPPRPSQDSDDNVVPTYYVERKKQRGSISQRKEEEGGLMHDLNAGILGEGLAAATRTRDEKIPVEVRLPDGTVEHPSGFAPPTPETDFHPVAAKVATEEHPLLSTVKQPWDEREFVEVGADPITICPDTEAEWVQRMVSNSTEGGVVSSVRDLGAERPVSPSGTSTTAQERSRIATSAWDSPARVSEKTDDPDSVVPPFYIERKRQRDSISERKEEEGGLMAELNAGILSDDLAAQIRAREEKIPVEVPLSDGTIAHPSGFVPPTAETEFHPVAAKPGDVPKQTWTEALAKKPSESTRGLHTSAVVRASEVTQLPTPLQRVLASQALTLDPDNAHASSEHIPTDPVHARREQYFPTLPSAPFWRPLLTVTLETRPLAHTFARLGKSLTRGTPYVAAIEDDERKDFLSFNTRMRQLQIERMHSLTYELGLRLRGMRGGLLGVRFSPEQRGRGVMGEGLADPIPKEKRVMRVGVGEWFPLADEMKERFLADAKRGGYEDTIEVFGVDEWGRRTDGKKWRGEGLKEGMPLEELGEGLEDDVD